MLAFLTLLSVSTWSCGVVLGECEFPSDHPDFTPQPQVHAQTLDRPRVYEYTDEFGNCNGCVRALNFCYRPHAGDNETLFTVEIRSEGGNVVLSRNVIVRSLAAIGNCERYSPGMIDCCVEQVLTEPFSVNQNHHFSLRVYQLRADRSTPLTSQLLRHQSDMTNGRQRDLGSDQYLTDSIVMIPKPLFFFHINIDIPNGQCARATTTTSIGSTSDSGSDSSTPSTKPPALRSSSSNTPLSSHTTTSSSTSSSSSSSTDKSTTTSSTTSGPGGPDQQSGGSSSNTGAVAGVIGVMLAILAVLTLAVSAVVVCVIRRQRRRKVVTSRAGAGENNGFVNVIYGASKGEKVEICTVPSKINTYLPDDKGEVKHQYEYINDLPSKVAEGPSSYTYASDSLLPQSPLISPYAAVGAEVSAHKRPSLHYEPEEGIYEAPASSVSGLYAQYEKIRITFIPRTAIEGTECLGSGQFGTVKKGVWQSSPSSPRLDVAIKTLNSSANEVDRVKFLQEGAIMGQFRHPNVVKLHGIVRDGQTVLLVIELLAKTDLREHLFLLRPQEGEEVDSSLPHTLLSYCRQVAAGMDYLSRKGFIHRDIAARNILLSEDQEICKIADFGMSRDLADETYYISSGGKIPVKWTAPEALHYKKYSTASDVWSFGCLMYEIWSLGHKPFEDYTNTQAIKMVDGGFRLAPPPGCPRALYQLMINCWNPTTSERPQSGEITQKLGRSDTVLLKWDVSDKPAAAPLALKLGAPLTSTTLLYPDLQRAYLPAEATDNDYEDTD